MSTRRLPLPLRLMSGLLLLQALAGCGSDKPEPLPPLSRLARESVFPNAGVPREPLARKIDALFNDEDAGETRALLVIHDGRVIAERYAAGYGRQTRFIGWSMTKSLTAVLIGLLVSDGRLRMDETAPVPAWQRPGDPRGEITLRQLLQMRSGLRHTESGDPPFRSDEVRMMFLDGRDDMAGYAEAQPLESVPGRRFEYSSATSVILADLATRALTGSAAPTDRRQAMGDFLRTRVLEPIGMRSALPEFDADGTFIGSSMLYATARDWGKFGEFLRNDGAVKGAQIVPKGWIEFMTRPSPRNPGYGAQIWLNRTQPDGKVVLFPGKAPASLFACLGHLGQYVIVSPEQNLTVVRLGKSDKAEEYALRNRLAAIVASFPKAQAPG